MSEDQPLTCDACGVELTEEQALTCDGCGETICDACGERHDDQVLCNACAWADQRGLPAGPEELGGLFDIDLG